MTRLSNQFSWSSSATPSPTEKPPRNTLTSELSPITKPVILICGHGARDSRCGILGPLLQEQFETVLGREGLQATVGQITHIGGHKFAGNVIIFVPPHFRTPDDRTGRARTWRSVWYGRVRPEHCEGIIQESVLKGRVIEELFRGFGA